MPRSTNAVASRRRRKKILQKAKGYFLSRSKVYTVAKNAVEKAGVYSYVGRKLKKRDYRALWITRINAAVRVEGLTYTKFICWPVPVKHNRPPPGNIFGPHPT